MIDPSGQVDAVVCFKKTQVLEAAKGSIEVACSKCAAALWMGPQVALYMAAKVAAVPVLCLDCMLEVAQDADTRTEA